MTVATVRRLPSRAQPVQRARRSCTWGRRLRRERLTFDRANVFTGRAGALLRGSFGSTGALWQPYLKGNLWWGSNGFDTVRFDADPIQTGHNGGTTLEGGGGITGNQMDLYGPVRGGVTWFADDLYRAIRPRIHLG